MDAEAQASLEASLRSEFPTEWAVVSSRDGASSVPKSVLSRVRQLGGLPTSSSQLECLSQLLELLRKRQKKPSKSASRWKLLRKAIRAGGAALPALQSLVDSRRRPLTAEERVLVSPEERSDAVETVFASGLRVVCCEPVATHVELRDLVASSSSAVDNTGNVRTWPAEQVLACLFARWRQGGLLHGWGGGTLVELGAGRSGECIAIAVSL
jgi:hypothetical protein